MTRPSLTERLKASRLFQVLIVYLGASWVVVEVSGELQDAFDLPSWLTPVAIVLLMVGLVVVLSTAWVQSHPLVDAREEAGEVPDSWEVGLGDFFGQIRRGKLPHLTWGRALLGGAVALSLLFGLAGLYVLTSGRGGGAGAAPLSAEEAGAGLAIVPFSVSGVDPEVYGEGIITLLGTTLDGVPGYRAIDSRTVLARWHELVADDEQPDLAQVLEVARRAGARYALVGSAVDAGTGVGLLGDIYDVETGAKIGTARAQGARDSLMALVDKFSVEASRLLVAQGSEGHALQHLQSLTTPSLEALLAYVEGEGEYQRGSFDAAVEAYERAIAQDTAFALAHLRAYQALGWSDGRGPRGAAHMEAAVRDSARLPARERALLAALAAADTRDREGFAGAEEAVRRYPDDPDLWNALGELEVHVGWKALRPLEDAREPLEQAAALAPDFLPYLIHLTEYAIAFDDSAAAAAALEREERLSATDADFLAGHRLAFEVIHGDSATRDAALQADATADQFGFAAAAALGIRNLAAKQVIWRAAESREPGNASYHLQNANTFAFRGQVSESLATLPATRWIGARNRTILYHYGVLPADSMLAADWEGFAVAGQSFSAALLGDMRAARAARDELAAELAEGAADSWLLRFVDAVIALQAEGPSTALPLLIRVNDEQGSDSFVFPYVQWIIGDAYERVGDDAHALEYFRSAGQFSPYAALRAARVADRMGKKDEARRHYQNVLMVWDGADPPFQPWVDEARGWLERVPG